MTKNVYLIFFGFFIFFTAASQDMPFSVISQFGIGSELIDAGRRVAYDSNQNILVFGTFREEMDFDPTDGETVLDPLGTPDLFLGKYQPDGNLIWVFNLGRIALNNGMDARGVVVDGNGDIIICGAFSNTVNFNPLGNTVNKVSNGSKDGFVAKYNTNGELIWAHTFGSTSSDICTAITLDDNNGIYIGVLINNIADVNPGMDEALITPLGNADAVLVNLSSNGIFEYAYQLGTTGNDEITSIGVGMNGNVGIGGYINGTQTAFAERDMYLAVLQEESLLWEINFDNSESDNEIGKIVFDADDAFIYIGGRIKGITDFDPSMEESIISPLFADAFMAKYSAADGTLQWAKYIESSGTEDYLTGMTLAGGAVLVAGSFDIMATFEPGDFSTQMISQGGQDIFFAAYNDETGSYIDAKIFGGSGSEFAREVIFADNGNALAGGLYGNTLALDPSLTPVSAEGFSDIFFAEFTYQLNLSTQNQKGVKHISMYPVPANDGLNIDLSDIDVSSQVSLRVINIVGQEVYNISKKPEFGKITLDTRELNSGIYILEINSNGSFFSKRFVKQ